MKIVHWTLLNGSGLNRLSINMSITERAMGLDSFVSYTNTDAKPIPVSGLEVLSAEEARKADIHVIHSHIPENIEGKTIFIPHGTPEHCFSMAIEQSKNMGYMAGDPLMLSLYRIDHSDVTVTFWDRHAYIWKSMNPKARIETVPMGIDTNFWKPTESQGKWAGEPSLLTCENCHQIKWPLDIILAFPAIMEKNPKIILHAHYLPMDTHRFWYPLLSANGTLYKSYTSGIYFSPPQLRNAFCSVDYYISPVRYGDFNGICLEAKASGCKVISYRGNPYADYWIDEGDQRIIASQIIEIINRGIKSNETEKIAGLEEMTSAMLQIYKSL